uniref:Zinc finger PMZ-type domain-containing protein n=1 Tax=Lactuca sativa TaxID=4236 RepID=A0A9R1V381_LACSA|nr:hypothetical protein LSAT_V11C600326300 [Lactuca sativa]
MVDMGQKDCSYRKWELTGIPCKHAIATLNEMIDNDENIYWLDTWKEMYSFKVDPIKVRAIWPKSVSPTTLLPPPHHKVVGKLKRKKKEDYRRERSQSQQGKSHVHSQSEN